MAFQENSNRNRHVTTVALIKAVKDKRCLWDRRSSSYKDREKRDKAWREIYKQFEPNFDDLGSSEKLELGLQITKKWYNVRDAYSKSRKNPKAKRPYVYAEKLSFLDPIYFDSTDIEQNNSDGSKNDDDCNTMEDDDDNSSKFFQEEVYLDEDGDIFEYPRKKSKVINSSATEVNGSMLEQRKSFRRDEEPLVSFLGNLIEREDDEDKSFFKSILSSVKSLSEDAKFEFRISVLQLIRALKKNDEGRTVAKDDVLQ